MNGFIFFVDGRLAPPDFFSARVTNTAANGMVATLVTEASKLKARPKSVDAFEVRSGSLVRRYHCDMDEGRCTDLAADDDNPARMRFTCTRVANNIF